MAKVDLGTKSTCLSCGMKFYDFKRTPIICPGCSTEFNVENLLTRRKGCSVVKLATSKIVAIKPNKTGDTDKNINIKKGSNVDVGRYLVLAESDLDYDGNDGEIESTDGPGFIQDEITENDELLPNLDDEDDD